MIDRERVQRRAEGSSDLAPLKKLPDWQVAEGDPDIRGWDVLDNQGNKIGQINDLVINRRTGEAAFAELAYGGSLGIGTKYTLIPIDDVKLDTSRKLATTNYDMESLKSAPEYSEDTSDFTPFSSFWAGVAAAAARGAGAPERQETREGPVQRFVRRMEPGKESEARREGEVPAAEPIQKVRVHVLHRTQSGDEVPLNEGDVLQIPVLGEGPQSGRRTAILDEIVIRLEALEEDEGAEEPRRFRI